MVFIVVSHKHQDFACLDGQSQPFSQGTTADETFTESEINIERRYRTNGTRWCEYPGNASLRRGDCASARLMLSKLDIENANQWLHLMQSIRG